MSRKTSNYNGGELQRKPSARDSRSSEYNKRKVAPSDTRNGATGTAVGASYNDSDFEYSNMPVIEATAVSAEGDAGLDEDFARFMEKKKSKLTGNSGSQQKSPASSSGIRNNLLKAWPPALRNHIVEKFRDGVVNIDRADDYLAKQNWPRGLRNTIIRSCKKLPLRFFLVDDSGSMIINDGKRLFAQGKNSRLIKCTRWAELSETMTFMAELSEALEVVSDFRLLNGADPVIVGLDRDGESLRFLKEAMTESPAGPTPLCQHIEAISQCIMSVERELRANGQKAVVVIATDGESSDGNVAEALRPLTNLPVLVILRLCTEEKDVVEYWDNIDNQLELDIDVLDDLLGDGRQVHTSNGWLTYGEPLHRMREFGASMKEMDIIDESTLSSEQMRVVCAYIFGIDNVKDIPHPGVDWRAFIAKIRELNNKEPKVFCPITETLKPWVDVGSLRKSECSICFRGRSGVQ